MAKSGDSEDDGEPMAGRETEVAVLAAGSELGVAVAEAAGEVEEDSETGGDEEDAETGEEAAACSNTAVTLWRREVLRRLLAFCARFCAHEGQRPLRMGKWSVGDDRHRWGLTAVCCVTGACR